jgi:hypothetical protein
VIATLRGAMDDLGELDLEPIDQRAELFGIDLAVVQALNFSNRELIQDHARSIRTNVLHVKC